MPRSAHGPTRPGLDLRSQLLADGAAARVPADAALHRGPATRDAPAAAVDRDRRRPNDGAARRVVAFADGRAASPGGTRSRVAIRRAGLPAPVACT